MFVIRPEQFAAMQEARNHEFASRLVPGLRAEYPACTRGVPDQELSDAVACSISHAQRAYGLKLDEDLIAFVELTFAVGPAFDQYEPFRMILTDESVPPDGRMTRLFTVAQPGDWEAASSPAPSGFREGRAPSRRAVRMTREHEQQPEEMDLERDDGNASGRQKRRAGQLQRSRRDRDQAGARQPHEFEAHRGRGGQHRDGGGLSSRHP